jgi:hypothetical protein
MENRERDRMSQRTTPTEAGEINRRTEEEKGRENSGTGAEFGQSIGRSEHLDEGEGGSMGMNNDRERKQSNIGENESSRRPSGESGYGSSTGRSGSMGDSDSSSVNQGSSGLGKNRRGSSSDTMENDDSSSGRH